MVFPPTFVPTPAHTFETRFASRLAGKLNDLYRYDPVKNTWTLISPSGPTPSPVYYPGFAAASDGVIYHLGGNGVDGNGAGRGGLGYGAWV